MFTPTLASTFTPLVPVSKVRATPTRASPGWQKSLLRIVGENAFDGLCHRLHHCCSFVVTRERQKENGSGGAEKLHT